MVKQKKIDSKEANEVRHHILSIRYACQFGEHMCKTHATLIKFNAPKMAILMHNRGVRTLGVPATSRILTGDCQKLSFSILRKVPVLIF